MYQIGDYVVKANNGVCRIESIGPLDMPGVDASKQYLFLVPVEDAGAKLYVSQEKADLQIRPVISEADAWELIHGAGAIEMEWTRNDKMREQEFKDALKKSDLPQLIGIMKNLIRRKKQRLAEGKKGTAIDERYYRMAEQAVYAELSFAIGANREKTAELLGKEIED